MNSTWRCDDELARKKFLNFLAGQNVCGDDGKEA